MSYYNNATLKNNGKVNSNPKIWTKISQIQNMVIIFLIVTAVIFDLLVVKRYTDGEVWSKRSDEGVFYIFLAFRFIYLAALVILLIRKNVIVALYLAGISLAYLLNQFFLYFVDTVDYVPVSVINIIDSGANSTLNFIFDTLLNIGNEPVTRSFGLSPGFGTVVHQFQNFLIFLIFLYILFRAVKKGREI